MPFRPSLPPDRLADYVARQFCAFFPDRDVVGRELRSAVDEALLRAEHCFGHIRAKYFTAGGDIVLDHRNTDQYAMFLYLLSRALHGTGLTGFAAKAYALNKALHGLDVFYEVQLPTIFCFQHPVGTVLGRATYSDYLFVYQRASTGAKDGKYPRLGEGVVLYPGAAVIGECTVGNNVWLSNGSLVFGQDIPSNSVVFGASPALTVKPTRRDVRRDLFGEER